MKVHRGANQKKFIAALRREIRRSAGTRYQKRLRGLLLVTQGASCTAVAKKFGDARRTVYYWVTRYQRDGFAGLADGRAGRPSRVAPKVRMQLARALQRGPDHYRLPAEGWNAAALSKLLKRRFGITLQVRQCYRLLKQLSAPSRSRLDRSS